MEVNLDNQSMRNYAPLPNRTKLQFFRFVLSVTIVFVRHVAFSDEIKVPAFSTGRDRKTIVNVSQ